MKGISAIAATAMFFLYFMLSSHAALAAVPGDACSIEGAAGVNGVMRMTCTSGVWVLDALKLGNSSVTCNSSNAGYIRWNGTGFSGCDGSEWGLTINYPINTTKAGLTLVSDTVADSDHITSGIRLHSSTGNSGSMGDIVIYHRGDDGAGHTPGLDIWGYPTDSSPGCCQQIMTLSTTGKVGIGGNAVAPFEVFGGAGMNGFMKLALNSGAPVTCSSTYKGSIAMTTNNGLCFCNGSAWNKVEAPTTACAW